MVALGLNSNYFLLHFISPSYLTLFYPLRFPNICIVLRPLPSTLASFSITTYSSIVFTPLSPTLASFYPPPPVRSYHLHSRRVTALNPQPLSPETISLSPQTTDAGPILDIPSICIKYFTPYLTLFCLLEINP